MVCVMVLSGEAHTNRFCVSVCISIAALLIARRSDVCNCCVQILVYVVLVLKK